MVRLHCLSAILGISIVAGCGKLPPSLTAARDGDAEVDAGQALAESEKYAEAIPHFERALQLPLRNYSKSDVYTQIGNCYNELDELEESLKYHDLALAEDPNNYKAYVNKGIVYRLIGEFDKAEEMYNKALVLAPDYAELHASLGALYIFQGKNDEAVAALEKAIQLDQTVAVAHANLAIAYATVERFEDAERELKRAIVLGYRNGEIVRERIDALRQVDTSSKDE